MLRNTVRAESVLADKAVDGLVLMRPFNVYYATGHWNRSMNARWDVMFAAVMPRDQSAPVVLVCPAMGLMFLATDPADADEIVPYLFPASDSNHDKAAPFGPPPVRSNTDPGEVDRAKLACVGNYVSLIQAHGGAALAKAVRLAGLEGKRLACDDPRATLLLSREGSSAKVDYRPEVIKEIRLVKTPAEIALLEQAAGANEAACRAVAQSLQPGWTVDQIQNAFAMECAGRGAEAVYLMPSIGELPCRGIAAGEATMLDALSMVSQYHGDFGRTVVVGGGDAETRRRARALTSVAEAVRDFLKPGRSYNQIIGFYLQALERQELPANPPTPHCLGLQHTDDPRPDDWHPGLQPDLVLEQGMVLNVDMPFLEVGAGMMHREDTFVITSDGCRTLTKLDDTLIET